MNAMSLLIVIVFAIVIIPCIQYATAIPYMSPQNLYKQSDMVFHGQVTSKQAGPGPDYYYYQIKVDTYFKNPQTSDSITVAGHKPGDAKAPYPQFEVDDKAIFYTQKMDGINTLSRYSQKAGYACDVSSFLEPAVVFHDTGIIRGMPTSKIKILDSNGETVHTVRINQQLVLRYDDISNKIPQARNIAVVFTIQQDNETQFAFYKKQDIQMIACDGSFTTSWNFTPMTTGHYNAILTYDDKKTETNFDVRENLDGGTINKTIMLSPLKQFKSGVAAKDVVCKQGLQIVIKSNDNSPACVKLNTANMLVERGWAKLIQ